MTCCVGKGHTDHTRTLGLVHELLVLARQAQKLAAGSYEPGAMHPTTIVLKKLRLRSHCSAASLDDAALWKPKQPAWLDQALRVQQQTAATCSAQVMPLLAGGKHRPEVQRRCTS